MALKLSWVWSAIPFALGFNLTFVWNQEAWVGSPNIDGGNDVEDQLNFLKPGRGKLTHGYSSVPGKGTMSD